MTLTAVQQENDGIVAAALASRVHVKELRVFGHVLALQGLADLRSKYLRDRASLESALARRDVAGKEYRRLKRLNAQQNVSDRSLQAAEAAWRIAAVNAHASKEALPVLENKIRLMWGDVIAGWLFEGSGAFQRLMQKKDVLVQVTFQPGTQVSPTPGSITILGATGGRITARLVSPAPETDPRIQGISFFYLAPPEGSLISGMNVAAYIPAGPPEKGVFLPGSAVVWWRENPWAYVQKSSEQFVRRKVPTQNPMAGGYFVVEGFREGESVVVRGAQMLLSEEFRTQIHGGE